MLKQLPIENRNGVLIQRTTCPTMAHFLGFVSANGADEEIFNDGATACYVSRESKDLFVFTEGDVAILDCPTRRALCREIYSHAQHHLNA